MQVRGRSGETDSTGYLQARGNNRTSTGGLMLVQLRQTTTYSDFSSSLPLSRLFLLLAQPGNASR